jgi:hypothetical protein
MRRIASAGQTSIADGRQSRVQRLSAVSKAAKSRYCAHFVGASRLEARS